MSTLEKHTNALAAYLPSGRLFQAKNINDSNFRKLLRGIAGELFRAQGYITLLEEFIPNAGVLFISEWEEAIQIPDDCFTVANSIEERQVNVLVKLASLGVQTAQDFIRLAEVFGKSVSIIPYRDENPSDESVAAYNTIIVRGEDLVGGLPPYDVPFDLLTDFSTFRCLFNKQIPSTTTIIYENV